MNDKRFAQFLIKPPEEKEEQIPEWLKKKSNDEAGGKGKRHKGEEGKMGKKTSKNKTGLYGLKGPKDNPDPHLAKMLAEEQAQKAGVLGIIKSQEGSHLASIFGRDSALGNDAENVLGGLVGTQIGEAYGVGGLGLVGSGKGGGGTGEGTIGLGNLGTIGKGGGGGNGSGYGRGAGGLGGRRAHAPDVVPGTAQVRGSLDKEIIRRIIRRHLNEVKLLLREGADAQAGPVRPRHDPVHHQRHRSGRGVGRAELDDEQPERRAVHRAGGSSLGVPEAAGRRYRHRLLSVRAQGGGRGVALAPRSRLPAARLPHSSLPPIPVPATRTSSDQPRQSSPTIRSSKINASSTATCVAQPRASCAHRRAAPPHSDAERSAIR